ncbi:MAG: sodium:proton antiporter [Blautia sp.]|nr:sodium:proton antiporter [Blautia sp.]
MSVSQAYHILFSAALIWFAVLLLAMLIRAIAGPRITDRILSINMIGTMVICCIAILSRLLQETWLVDVALIYAMISFISVLILAMIYIPNRKSRGKYAEEVRDEVRREREWLTAKQAENAKESMETIKEDTAE